MTVVKEAVNGAIEALKGSPIVLALVLFQFFLLGAVSWNAHEVRDTDRKRFELLLQNCQMRLQSDESHPVELPKQ